MDGSPDTLSTGLIVPASPLKLTKDEQRVYDDVGALLAQENLLTVIDGYALATFAQDVVFADELRRKIRVEGTAYTVGERQYPNPRCATLASTVARIASAQRAFGMTPAGRKAIGKAGNPRKTNADNAKSRWSRFKQAK